MGPVVEIASFKKIVEWQGHAIGALDNPQPTILDPKDRLPAAQAWAGGVADNVSKEGVFRQPFTGAKYDQFVTDYSAFAAQQKGLTPLGVADYFALTALAGYRDVNVSSHNINLPEEFRLPNMFSRTGERFAPEGETHPLRVNVAEFRHATMGVKGKPPLVILHGLAENGPVNFASTAINHAWRTGDPVYVFSFMGHGESPYHLFPTHAEHTKKIGFNVYTEILSAGFKWLEGRHADSIGKWGVLAHSMGAAALLGYFQETKGEHLHNFGEMALVSPMLRLKGFEGRFSQYLHRARLLGVLRFLMKDGIKPLAFPISHLTGDPTEADLVAQRSRLDISDSRSAAEMWVKAGNGLMTTVRQISKKNNVFSDWPGRVVAHVSLEDKITNGPYAAKRINGIFGGRPHGVTRVIDHRDLEHRTHTYRSRPKARAVMMRR